MKFNPDDFDAWGAPETRAAPPPAVEDLDWHGVGKIARLPKPLREELNLRLEAGVHYRHLTGWLNHLPEVQAILARDFEGRPINKVNLHSWANGGFLHWQAREERFQFVERLAQQGKTPGSLGRNMEDWLLARATQLSTWLDQNSATLPMNQQLRLQRRVERLFTWVERIRNRREKQERKLRVQSVKPSSSNPAPSPNPTTTAPSPSVKPSSSERASQGGEGSTPAVKPSSSNPAVPAGKGTPRAGASRATEPSTTPTASASDTAVKPGSSNPAPSPNPTTTAPSSGVKPSSREHAPQGGEGSTPAVKPSSSNHETSPRQPGTTTLEPGMERFEELVQRVCTRARELGAQRTLEEQRARMEQTRQALLCLSPEQRRHQIADMLSHVPPPTEPPKPAATAAHDRPTDGDQEIIQFMRDARQLVYRRPGADSDPKELALLENTEKELRQLPPEQRKNYMQACLNWLHKR